MSAQGTRSLLNVSAWVFVVSFLPETLACLVLAVLDGQEAQETRSVCWGLARPCPPGTQHDLDGGCGIQTTICWGRITFGVCGHELGLILTLELKDVTRIVYRAHDTGERLCFSFIFFLVRSVSLLRMKFV